MKKNILKYSATFLSFILIVLTILFKNNVVIKKYKLGEEIKIQVNETIKVDDLNISLLHIVDSTCPKDANCIWQGEYSYQLSINNDKVILGTVKNSEVKYKDYQIKLSEDNTLKYVKIIVNKN